MSASDFVYTGQDNLEAMKKAKNYNRYLANLASSRVAGKKKARIIDFGAGIGTYASLLRDKGYENLDCLKMVLRHLAQFLLSVTASTTLPIASMFLST